MAGYWPSVTQLVDSSPEIWPWTMPPSIPQFWTSSTTSLSPPKCAWKSREDTHNVSPGLSKSQWDRELSYISKLSKMWNQGSHLIKVPLENRLSSPLRWRKCVSGRVRGHLHCPEPGPSPSFAHLMTPSTITHSEALSFLLLVNTMAKCKLTAHAPDATRDPRGLGILGLRRLWGKGSSIIYLWDLEGWNVHSVTEVSKCLDLWCFLHKPRPSWQTSLTNQGRPVPPCPTLDPASAFLPGGLSRQPPLIWA